MVMQMQEFVGITNPFNFREVVTKGQKKFIVSGYISTMDVDLVGDQITSECLQDMLTQIQSGNVKMDWEHETIIEEDLNKVPRARIIPETAKVDGKGLWVEAEVNPDHMDFSELWGSIKNKFLDAFSIAFRPIEAVVQWAGDKAIRILNKIKLINVGITGNPVNEEARMDQVMVKALNSMTLGTGALPKKVEEKEESSGEEEGAKEKLDSPNMDIQRELDRAKEPMEKKALTYEGQQVYAGEKSNMDMVAGKFSKAYDIEKDLILEGMQEEMIHLQTVNNDMETIAKIACTRVKADPEHYKKLKAIENRESYSTKDEAEAMEEKSEVTEVTYEDEGTKMDEEVKKKQYSDDEKMKDHGDYKSEIATLKSDIADLKAAVEELKTYGRDKEKMKKEDYDEGMKGKKTYHAMDKDTEYDTDKKSMLADIKSLKDQVSDLASQPVLKSLPSEVPTKLNEKELPSVLGLIR